jgi:TolA-binding protein
MLKRNLVSVLLFALASAAFAQDMTSPAIPGPERTSLEPLSPEEMRLQEQRLKEYWTTHDSNAPAYPFNP